MGLVLSAKSSDPKIELVFFLLFVGGFFLHRGLKTFLRSRQTEDLAVSKISSAPQGWVAIEGQAWPTVERKSMDGRATCYLKLEILKYTSNGRNGSWKTVCSYTSKDEFIVLDQSGSCLVDPDSAELHLTEVDKMRNNLTEDQKELICTAVPGAREYLYVDNNILDFLFGADVRVLEWKVLVGSPIYVSGEMVTSAEQNTAVAVGDVAGYSSQMAKIKSNSYQMRMFDTNRDGKLSDTELLDGHAGAANIFFRKGGVQSLPIVGKLTGHATHGLVLSDTSQAKLASRTLLHSLLHIAGGLAALVVALRIFFQGFNF